MTLEDVVNAGKDHFVVRNIAAGFKKEPHNPQFLAAFLEFCNNERDYLPEELRNAMREDLETNPFKLNRMLNEASTTTKNRLVGAVSENYNQIMSNLSDKAYETLTLELPDEDKDFDVVERKIQQGDIESARKAYAKTFNSPMLKHYLENEASDEFIVKHAGAYAEIAKSKFLDKYTREVKHNGKRVKQIDHSKLRSYAEEQIAGYGEDKDKKTAYGLIGELYTAQKANGKSHKAAA